ncbi:MAG: hypothetical protein BGN96_08045 [Bacteroidales bacterium 45-6]|nr:MAG: hypothetical protein BGN96_08045 [Bacteroidales bacterium 45-6]
MKDENIHIGELFKNYFSYWKIYVPIGLLSFFVAVAFVLVTPKEYDITAKMQFLKEEDDMSSELKMLKNTGVQGFLGGGKGNVSTLDQIEVFSSRANVLEVIRKTGYQVQTTVKRGLKNLPLGTDESPIRYVFPAQFLDTISSSFSIKIELENNVVRKLQVSSNQFEEKSWENKTLPFNLHLPIGNLTIQGKPNCTGTFHTTVTPIQKAYETLSKEIVIKAIRESGTDIVGLYTMTSNRKSGCLLLNAFMDQYNEYSKAIKIQKLSVNGGFVKDRLDTVTRELAFLERKIEIYKQTNKIPIPDVYGSVTYYGNVEVEKSILEMETRLKLLDYVLNYVRNPANTYSAIPLLEGISEASSGYNQLLLNRQRLLQTSELSNPSVVLVDNQLKEQRKMLLEAIGNIRNSIMIQLNALYHKDNSLSDDLNKLPSQEQAYIEMKRQQKIKESIYLFLMQKLQEKELANSPDEVAMRVIDPAYSSYKTVYPKKIIVFGIAFAIASVLSICIITAKIFYLNKEG